MLRIIGAFLILGILFSYVPMIPMDDCPEGHHTGSPKMDCGYSFHCPFVSSMNISGLSALPLLGRLVLIAKLSKVDELSHSIFHPPEVRVAHTFYRG